MNRSTLLCGVLGVTLAVAGCAREEMERAAVEDVTVAAEEDRGFRTEEPAEMVAVPDTADNMTFTGNLREMHNSGVEGGVTLTPRNGQTDVLLRIRGVRPGTQVYPAIYRGGCDAVGDPAVRMEAVTVDEAGVATPTRTANMTMQQLTDGQHSIRIYPEARVAEIPPLACTEIPAWPASRFEHLGADDPRSP